MAWRELDEAQKKLIARNTGINFIKNKGASYHVAGLPYIGRDKGETIVNPEVGRVTSIVTDMMSNNTAQFKSSDIWKRYAPSNYGAYPQYTVEQLLGLKNGMTVFAFDIENIGHFDPKTRTSKMFMPTELTISALDVNLSSPERYKSPDGKTNLSGFFKKRNNGNMNLLFKDNDVLDYYEGLSKKLGNMSGTNKVLSGFSDADLRSLRDLLKYAGDAEIVEGRVVRQNTAALPHLGLLNSRHAKDIDIAIQRIRANGLDRQRISEEVNSFVNKHTSGSFQKAFKTMAFNGNTYDVPGLEHLVKMYGMDLDLVNPNAGFSGNLDPFNVMTGLLKDPLRYFFGKTNGARSLMDLRLQTIGPMRFGYDKSMAHMAEVDVNMMIDTMNYMMPTMKKSFIDKAPEYLATDTFKMGDRVYARRGMSASAETIFDGVFKLNNINGQFEKLDNMSAPLFSGMEYVFDGQFEFTDKGVRKHALRLYNEDEDLYHLLIRDDPRELANLMQHHFTVPDVLVGEFKGNELIRKTPDSLIKYKDRARRSYLRMFTPDGNAIGSGFGTLKKNLDVRDTIREHVINSGMGTSANWATVVGNLSSQDIVGIATESRRTEAIKNHIISNKLGTEANWKTVADSMSSDDIRKLSRVDRFGESQARNFKHMFDRFNSEYDLLKPFADSLQMEVDAKRMNYLGADLAVSKYMDKINEVYSPNMEGIQQVYAANQMFIYNPSAQQYNLMGVTRLSDMSSSLTSSINKGASLDLKKTNAVEIISDLKERGYITGRQAGELRDIVMQMSAGEMTNPSTSYFARSIAATLQQNGVVGDDGYITDQFIKKTANEFRMAQSRQTADAVTQRNPDVTGYFYNRLWKDNIKANYMQESMNARSFSGVSFDEFRTKNIPGVLQDAANASVSAGTIFDKGTLRWSDSDLDFFQKYDKMIVDRFSSISNPSKNVDFARGYKGLRQNLDDLASAYMEADPDSLAFALLDNGDKHQGIMMAIVAKSDAESILREVGRDPKSINNMDNVTRLFIPLVQEDGTFTFGNQNKVSPTFLKTRYGIDRPRWSDVYAQTVTEATIEMHRISAKSLIDARNQSGGITQSNSLAKRNVDRVIRNASGSGKQVHWRESESALDATTNEMIQLRRDYVNVTGLTGLYDETRGVDFDNLVGDTKQNFYRLLQRDFWDHGLHIGFQGSKVETVLGGNLSAGSGSRFVPYGLYGPDTRDNYLQVQNYRSLSDLEEIPLMERRTYEVQGRRYSKLGPAVKADGTLATMDRYTRMQQAHGADRAREMTSPILMTESQYGAFNGQARGLTLNVGYVDDLTLAQIWKDQGLDSVKTPTTFDGTMMMANDLMADFTVPERKQIIIPPGMKFNEDTLKLLERAEAGEKIYLDPLADPTGKITIGTDMTGEVVSYTDRHTARILGRYERSGGQTVLELEQILPAYEGTKFYIGTDKGTWRGFDRQKARETVKRVKGYDIGDVDVLVSGTFKKNEDWNNFITGDVTYALAEAQRKYSPDEFMERAQRAFKDNFGQDVRFEKTKVTIGKHQVESITAIIDDLTDYNLTASGKKARKAIGVNGDGVISMENIRGFYKTMDIGMPDDMGGEFIVKKQQVRVANIPAWAKPFGSKAGLDEGVKYTSRELEMIRNRHLVIGGRDLGRPEETYSWLSESIADRARQRFGEGGGRQQAIGVSGVLDAQIGKLSMKDGDHIVRTRVSGGTPINNQRNFDDIVPIGNISDLTDKSQLAGTILDPKFKDSRGGVWFETPFDFTLESDARPRNSLYMYVDDVMRVDGHLQATELQGYQLQLERASRNYLLATEHKRMAPDGKIISGLTDEAANELAQRAVNSGQDAIDKYYKSAGKYMMGSHGTISGKAMSAKLTNSAHFTLAGTNIYVDPEAMGKGTRANTSFISREFAEGMLRDSGLSEAQRADIISYMTSGEGIVGLTNRYPTFDPNASLFGFTKIDSSLQGDSVIMSIGDVFRLKGDYDGDHISKIFSYFGKLENTGLKYSQVIEGYTDANGAYHMGAKQYADKVVSGGMRLSDIKDDTFRFFTEMYVGGIADAEKSDVLSRYVKAEAIAGRFGEIDENGKLKTPKMTVPRLSEDMSFDQLNVTESAFRQMEWFSREARITKQQVGAASNMNARVRRMVEALEGVNIQTVGKDTASDIIVGANLFESILPGDIWDKVNTSYATYEQSGINMFSKHIRRILKEADIDVSNITRDQEEKIYKDLGKFKLGMETMDSDLLWEAQRGLSVFGLKDMLRQGGGDVSSMSMDKAFQNSILDATPEEADALLKSFRRYGQSTSNLTESLISSVEQVGMYAKEFNFRSNAFLKYGLSEPSSEEQAARLWRQLSDPLDKDFIPTAEVERFYSLLGREDDFLIGKRNFEYKARFLKTETMSKYIGMEGNNFARLASDTRPIHTIGDDTIQAVKSKIFDGIGGQEILQGGMAGAAVFGAMWAASALVRGDTTEDDGRTQGAQEIAPDDAPYVDPSAFGPAPRGAGPSARIAQRGGGYENIQIQINAKNAKGWSEDDIRDIVHQQLSEQMPMGVNMNVRKKDDSRRIDRQWVQDTVSKSIKYGYAF